MMCTVDAWFSSCSADAECVRPAPEKKWLGNRDENGLGAYEGPTSPIWCCDALKFYLRQICDIDMKSSLPTVILDMQSAGTRSMSQRQVRNVSMCKRAMMMLITTRMFTPTQVFVETARASLVAHA